MTLCLNPDCQKPQNPEGNKFCQNCGSKLLLADRYRVEQAIGAGSFSKTFLAIDELVPGQDRCVIKQFRHQSQKAAESFEGELRKIEQLSQHPQIPNLLASFEQNGRQYLVQEFIKGKNLERELADSGTFSQNKIRQLLEAMLPVLHLTHSYGLIHRDIKPENIIIRPPSPSISSISSSSSVSSVSSVSRSFAEKYKPENKAKEYARFVLVDFGVAKQAAETAIAHSGTLVGSAEYTAPEQLMGRAKFASDIYSLGVTCIHLLSGMHPFELFDSAAGTWVWRDYLLNPVGNSFAEILDKMLRSPNQRYASAKAVLKDLNPRAIASLPEKPPAPEPNLESSNSEAKSKAKRSPSNSQSTLPGNTAAKSRGNSEAKSKAKRSPSNYESTYKTNTGANPPRMAEVETLPDFAAESSLESSQENNTIAPPLETADGEASNEYERSAPKRSAPNQSTLKQSTPKQSAPNQSTPKPFIPRPTWQCVRTMTSADSYSEIASEVASEITSVAFSSQSSTLAAGSWDGTIRLWDLVAGNLLHILKSHSNGVVSLAASTDGKTLASGSADSTILLWRLWQLSPADIRQGIEPTPTRRLTGHGSIVASLAISTDGALLASGSRDMTVKLWNLKTGELLQTLTGHTERVIAVAFSGDRAMLASGSQDKTILIWKLDSGELKYRLTGHTGAVYALAISPDGKRLASCSWDRTIKIWDLQTGELLQDLSGHFLAATSAAISPDGKILATGSHDTTIKLWNLDSPKELATLTGHSKSVTAVRFSPDGTAIASASADGTVKLWRQLK
ncbi:MAG: protein kinase [Oscillatoria sp. SIO1A7]|nr:protein kinase [Oscillatoria sp. SIO1A7]